MQARLYGHRGAAAERPENTLPSFARALDCGADALELDVHMTRDGHIVVSHDPDVRRMTGKRRVIRRTDLADLSRLDAGYGFVDGAGERPFAGKDYRIPTLEQVLTEFPHAGLNVDIKQRWPAIDEPLLELIHRHRAEERVTLASFSLLSLIRVRRRGYRSTALATAEVQALLFTPMALFRRLPIGGTAAQIPPRAGHILLGCREIIDKCHDLGMRVDFWTVDDPEQATALLELGADGIMTNDPAAIAPVFERYRAASAL